MKLECFFPHSQDPATCPYPEPDRSSPSPPSHFSKIYFSIILLPTLWSSNWFFPSVFRTKTLYAPTLFPYVLHAPPISFFVIWLPECYLVRNTEHNAPCYVVFHTLLLPRTSCTQISSSAPYSRKDQPKTSSLNVSDQVSDPYKRTDKTIVLYILIIPFLDSKLEDERFCSEWQQALSQP